VAEIRDVSVAGLSKNRDIRPFMKLMGGMLAFLALSCGGSEREVDPVVVSLRSANPPARPVETSDGIVVVLPGNTTPLSAIIEIDARLPAIDPGGEKYTVTTTMEGAGWTITNASPAESPDYPEGTSELLFRPTFRVTASSPTSAAVTIAFTVKSDRNAAHVGRFEQVVRLE
jgi:hypothetical protein